MPNRYPQEAVTRDGRPLLIRPMKAADGDALYDFFQRLPAETRRFAWDRISDRSRCSKFGPAHRGHRDHGSYSGRHGGGHRQLSCWL